MPLTFKCIYCGVEHLVDKKDIGRRERCSNCGASIIIQPKINSEIFTAVDDNGNIEEAAQPQETLIQKETNDNSVPVIAANNPPSSQFKSLYSQMGITIAIMFLYTICNIASYVINEIALSKNNDLVKYYREVIYSVTSSHNPLNYNWFVIGALFGFGLLALLSYLFFATWMYRMHRNLRTLGCNQLEFDSYWAYFVWLFPFVNCILPWLFMREVWQGIQRTTPTNDQSETSTNEPSNAKQWRTKDVDLWWLIYVIPIAIFSFSLLNMFILEINDSAIANFLTQLYKGTYILGMFLSIRLVMLGSRMQEEQYQRIRKMERH